MGFSPYQWPRTTGSFLTSIKREQLWRSMNFHHTSDQEWPGRTGFLPIVVATGEKRDFHLWPRKTGDYRASPHCCDWEQLFATKKNWWGRGFSPLLWLRTTGKERDFHQQWPRKTGEDGASPHCCDKWGEEGFNTSVTKKNWGGRGFSPLLWARTTGEKRRLNAGNPPLPLPTLCSSSVLCVLLFSIIMTLTMDSLSHKSILRPTSISCCCWLAKLSLTNSLASSFKIYTFLAPNCILLKTLYSIVVSSLKANCFQENYKCGFSEFSKIFHQLFITFKNSWVMMLFLALPKTKTSSNCFNPFFFSNMKPSAKKRWHSQMRYLSWSLKNFPDVQDLIEYYSDIW